MMKRTFQHLLFVAPQLLHAFAPSHSFLLSTTRTRTNPTVLALGGEVGVVAGTKGATVVELKAALKSRGLKVSGTKAELLTRLSDADKLSAGDLPLTASASERLTTAQVVPPSQGASTKKDDAFNDEEGFSFSRPSLITSLYTRAPDDPIGDSFADLPAVEALLLARQQAREARNFKQADKLRAELSAMGVEVSDSTYTWRADGFARMRAAHGYRFSALRSSSSSSSVYSESPHSLSRVSGSSTVSDVDAIAEATVASGALTRGGRGRHKNALTLVAELLEQHVAEQQSLSPEHETTAQATLKREHHVEVDDVSKEWFVVVQAGDDDGESRAAKSEAKAIAKAEAKAAAKAATRAAGLGVHGHDYRRSRLDQSTTSKEQEIEIHKLLAARVEAKFRADFARADNIQEELRREWNVEVDDASKEWRADGTRTRQQGASRGHARDRYKHSSSTNNNDGARGEGGRGIRNQNNGGTSGRGGRSSLDSRRSRRSGRG